MNEKASLTALMSAFGRAYHAKNDEAPIFNDNLAHRLLSESEYIKMSRYIVERFNFFVYEHMTRNDIQNEYFAGRRDYLSAFECINYALAVLKIL